MGDGAFSAIAPKLWNDFPAHVRMGPSLLLLLFKLVLFRKCFIYKLVTVILAYVVEEACCVGLCGGDQYAA